MQHMTDRYTVHTHENKIAQKIKSDICYFLKLSY